MGTIADGLRALLDPTQAAAVDARLGTAVVVAPPAAAAPASPWPAVIAVVGGVLVVGGAGLLGVVAVVTAVWFLI
jgi:hypothetical protein